MKYLKIENNNGFYWNGSVYQEIDKLNKEGLLVLLNAAEKDDFSIDPYDATLLANKAHQIIYENIYNKLTQFLSDKDQFKTEVDKLYKEAIDKYSVDITKVNIKDNLELEETLSFTSDEEISF